MPPRSLARLLIAVLAACLANATALAGSVNVNWSPSPGATGYNLYCGASSGTYETPLDVGNSTGSPVDTMADCVPSYFAVTAYNAAGESTFSNEIATWPRPEISGTNDSEARRGDQIDLVVTGLNFQPGASLQFSNPDIAVNSTSVDACGQITVGITIGASAPFGPTNIVVTNPNGVAGSASGLFSVVGDPLPTVQNARRTDTLPES